MPLARSRSAVAPALLALALAWTASAAPSAAPTHAAGARTIVRKDVELHLWNLASAPLEGRGTASAGQERAAGYIATLYRDAGLLPLSKLPGGSPRTGGAEASTQASDGLEPYLWTFHRRLPEPDPGECALRLEIEGEEPVDFELGRDFVPVHDLAGSAVGDVVFLGFGIESRGDRYDDLRGKDVKGCIALILEGEPRHSRRFEGFEVTEAASLWAKVRELARRGAKAILVVRRLPQTPAGAEKSKGQPPVDLEPPELDFRHEWASWQGRNRSVSRPRKTERIPVLEITAGVADRILGQDVLAIARKIDKNVRPASRVLEGVRVRLTSQTRTAQVEVDNVTGWVPGSDPELADEYVIVGAHYDHIGVGPRGRIAYGADDNASGVSAMLEIMQAVAAAGPRRSAIFVAFAGEEVGLLGSEDFARRLPVPASSAVAMLNLDMIGRGRADQVVVLGVHANPELEDVLTRARRLSRTGIKNLEIPRSDPNHLWDRSDHAPFHDVGIPSLFLFEGLPVSRNKDYHTWRDTIEGVDQDKVTHTAQLGFNAVWILASDDDRPPPPRR